MQAGRYFGLERVRLAQALVACAGFSDTVAGANASAIIYSIMLTCRACNIEPYSYLRHVLTEMPQRSTDADITDLLPFNFQSQAASAIG
jgi:transposase